MCFAYNFKKSNQKSQQITVVPRQLFLQKSKDEVFAEPLLDLMVDDVLLTKWKFESLQLDQWRENFQCARNVAETGDKCNENEL